MKSQVQHTLGAARSLPRGMEGSRRSNRIAAYPIRRNKVTKTEEGERCRCGGKQSGSLCSPWRSVSGEFRSPQRYRQVQRHTRERLCARGVSAAAVAGGPGPRRKVRNLHRLNGSEIAECFAAMRIRSSRPNTYQMAAARASGFTNTGTRPAIACACGRMALRAILAARTTPSESLAITLIANGRLAEIESSGSAASPSAADPSYELRGQSGCTSRPVPVRVCLTACGSRSRRG